MLKTSYYHLISRYKFPSRCPVEVSNISNLKLGYNSIKLENETAEVSDLPFSETDPHFLFLLFFSVKEMNMIALPWLCGQMLADLNMTVR